MSINSVVVADFIADRHFSTYQITTLLAIYSAISIPTRLIVGFSCDQARMTVSTMGFSLAAGPLTTTVPTTYIWYSIFGIFSGLASTQEGVVIAHLSRSQVFSGRSV